MNLFHPYPIIFWVTSPLQLSPQNNYVVPDFVLVSELLMSVPHICKKKLICFKFSNTFLHCLCLEDTFAQNERHRECHWNSV